MKSALVVLLANVVAGAYAGRATPPPVVMPDGSTFEFWSDQTRYHKTYHVSQRHPRASDANPGTAELPFATINRASADVRPQERVQIHAGIYREMVEPRFSGESPSRMIAYEAVPGEEVIIRGSQLLNGVWERSRYPHGIGLYSRKLWMTKLPDAIFDGGYLPFDTPNASDQELDLMPWALRWKGKIPYTLTRGLVFQEGVRMVQLATYEDLVRLPGSYWVAADRRTVHIHPYGGQDPNGKSFEVTVTPHLFTPRSTGTGYIRVSGLVLEHCANGFPRIGIGAIYTRGGHHWIIERNTVRHVNSVGIEAGYRTFEKNDTRQVERTDPDLGHNIVRRNRVYDCGTAGIRSHTVSHGLYEENEISDCGWQDAEYHHEVAGIKLLVNTGTLVRNNHIYQIEGGGGIWLDWDNRNSRVTGNLIHDIDTHQGAVFVEASQQPNIVDHNVIWNISGQGIRAADTDNLTIAHNLMGLVAGELVYAKSYSKRTLNGRKVTSRNNRVLNNIFFDARKPVLFGEPDQNGADYNTYIVSRGEGFLPDAGALRGKVSFSAEDLSLSWALTPSLAAVPVIEGCDRDFFGRPRSAGQTVAGPFLELLKAEVVSLRRRR